MDNHILGTFYAMIIPPPPRRKAKKRKPIVRRENGNQCPSPPSVEATGDITCK
jgi:hypothetical protein